MHVLDGAVACAGNIGRSEGSNNSCGCAFPFTFRFNTAVKQKAAYLWLIHLTSDDVPSCFRLMELSLVCHGTVLFLNLVAIYAETVVPGEILVTVRRIPMVRA